MPYFHATRRSRMPSILAHGLGGIEAPQNFECEPGIYLSTDPYVCITFLLEHYMVIDQGGMSPRDAVADFVVIVIDDSRVTGNLRPDHNVPESWQATFLICDRPIDVTGMPVLGVDDLQPVTEAHI